MIIFYSGQENLATPERVLGKKANLMLTFFDYYKAKKIDKRFKSILKARRKGKPNDR